MTIYQPYTYWLFHKPSRKFYYGSKTARECHPAQLFVSYFSSSKVVKDLIEKDGVDSFRFKVHKLFDTAQEAIDYEYEILRKFEAGTNDRFLNKHHTKSVCWTEEMRRKASHTHKQKIVKGTHKTAFKRGHKPTKGFGGRVHSEETKKMLAQQRSGVNNVSRRESVKKLRRQRFLKHNPMNMPHSRNRVATSNKERSNTLACCIKCGREMSVSGLLSSHYPRTHLNIDPFH